MFVIKFMYFDAITELNVREERKFSKTLIVGEILHRVKNEWCLNNQDCSC